MVTAMNAQDKGVHHNILSLSSDLGLKAGEFFMDQRFQEKKKLLEGDLNFVYFWMMILIVTRRKRVVSHLS